MIVCSGLVVGTSFVTLIHPEPFEWLEVDTLSVVMSAMSSRTAVELDRSASFVCLRTVLLLRVHGMYVDD